MSRPEISVPGIDIVPVADIAQSITRFGSAYLDRTFTRTEQELAGDLIDAQRAEFYAGRFAAKEAVVKALRHPRAQAMSWLDIEIGRSAGGWPTAVLDGPLAQWAAEVGIQEVTVSISHDGGLAVAVAVAQSFRREDTQT